MPIYVPILICVLIIVYYYVSRKHNDANTYNHLHPLFLKSVSYMDYVRATHARNPIMYFELRQLYKYKPTDVTKDDYMFIINKYKAFKK